MAVVLGGVLACGIAGAQSDADGIKADLTGKPLILRGFWEGKRLEFDAAGKPVKQYAVQSFTVSGFDMSQVTVSGDRVEIQGKRVGLRLDQVPEVREPLDKMTIVIDRKGGEDVGPALKAIFAGGVGEVVGSLPGFWQPYARKRWIHSDTGAPGAQPAAAAKTAEHSSAPPKSQGRVSPPVLIHADDPEFTAEARSKKVTGNVQVYMWVGEDGLPSHVRIVRPLGLGLDEFAVASVLKYRFKPSMQDGKPVKVDLYIEVNFAIF
ncbi:MAG: energy transducer TonB [Acidobacteriota bacterium]